ncbi:hypothetical protein IEQ34_004293 [Dendrobium chrysotoxum]|uniref:Uncharacterized protein n=1 Tax=Dendrobium chrysotoxum TaxID=161865 RepID=A0AAV7GZ17_DENCH|nr:hypothetical protein IEQ34_004293 [Dendrobium chrysotoxum]
MHFEGNLALGVDQMISNRRTDFATASETLIRDGGTTESWFEAEAVAKGGCLFPCLIELYLKDCPPKLQEFPSLPPKLRKLEINNIGLAAIRNLTIRNDGDLIYLKGLKGLGTTKNSQLILNKLIIKDPSVLLMESLSNITSIQKLTIKGNDELVSFLVETEQWFLQVSSCLRELNFISLKSLQTLHLFLGLMK